MKFRIEKRISLAYLGEEWEKNGCFLSFQPLTVKDLKENLSGLSKIDENNAEEVTHGMEQALAVMKTRFIKGQGIDDEGKVVDITAEDLIDLPAEVLIKTMTFLSQAPAEDKPTQSATS